MGAYSRNYSHGMYHIFTPLNVVVLIFSNSCRGPGWRLFEGGIYLRVVFNTYHQNSSAARSFTLTSVSQGDQKRGTVLRDSRIWMPELVLTTKKDGNIHDSLVCSVYLSTVFISLALDIGGG